MSSKKISPGLKYYRKNKDNINKNRKKKVICPCCKNKYNYTYFRQFHINKCPEIKTYLLKQTQLLPQSAPFQL